MTIFRRRRFCLTVLAVLCMMFTFKMTLQFHRLLEQYASQIVILSVEDPIIAFVNDAKQRQSHGTNNTMSRSHPEETYNAAFVKLLSRKFRLKSMCKPSMHGNRSINVNVDEYLKHIAVNDKKQLLVCALDDAENSPLFQAFVSPNGKGGRDAGVVEKLKFLNTFESTQQNLRLHNYTKVAVVRDPLERLMVTFRNKFQLSSRQRRQENYENLVEFYRRHQNLSRKPRTLNEYAHEPLVFEEYLKYWVDKFSMQENNEEQFMTYNDICRPCVVPYDYVLHVDDNEEVIRAIAKKLPLDVRNAIRTSDKREYIGINKDNEAGLGKSFKDISRDVLTKVSEIVCVDSVMFGFTDDERICNRTIRFDSETFARSLYDRLT